MTKQNTRTAADVRRDLHCLASERRDWKRMAAREVQAARQEYRDRVQRAREELVTDLLTMRTEERALQQELRTLKSGGRTTRTDKRSK